MSAVLPHSSLYDDITDVMFFRLGDSQFTSEEEVLPGVHVLYEYDGEVRPNVVAVEIEYFKERFDGHSSLEIPAARPFTLSFACA